MKIKKSYIFILGIYVFMLGLILTGCSSGQSNTENEENDSITIEDAVKNVKYYRAHIDVSLEASGDLNQTTADIFMSYNTDLSVDLRKNIAYADSVNEMTLEGTSIEITTDSYRTECYLESDNIGNRCYISRTRGETPGSWIMKEEPDITVTKQFDAFINTQILPELDRKDSNSYEGDVSGNDIAELAEQLRLLEIDGGLLLPEVVEQLTSIHLTYIISDETLLPTRIILDLTNTYNETVGSAGDGEVSEFIIAIELEYPDDMEIIKPNMGEVSIFYNSENP